MLIIEDIQQLRKVHLMIQKRRTGTPDEFASSLCVSRRKMYYLIDILRNFGAEIVYSRTNHTFYYDKGFELEISLKVKKTKYEDWQDISGGYVYFPNYTSFRADFLHGNGVFEIIFA